MIENYQSASAQGISLAFLTVWFVGDLANFFGSVWADLVPTVIALAVYFCVADAVLITQCLYYYYVKPHKLVSEERDSGRTDDPSQPLLHQTSGDIGLPGSRRPSSISQKHRRSSLAASTSPIILDDNASVRPWLINLLSVLAVCALGAVGWTIAWKVGLWKPVLETSVDTAQRNWAAEVLGYVSAILYLGYIDQCSNS